MESSDRRNIAISVAVVALPVVILVGLLTHYEPTGPQLCTQIEIAGARALTVNGWIGSTTMSVHLMAQSRETPYLWAAHFQPTMWVPQRFWWRKENGPVAIMCV